RIVEHAQRTHPGAGLAAALIQVLLLHVEQRPAARLGGQQHGQGTVLLEGDGRDGVHDDPEASAHEGTSAAWREAAGGTGGARASRVASELSPVKVDRDGASLCGLPSGTCATKTGDRRECLS